MVIVDMAAMEPITAAYAAHAAHAAPIAHATDVTSIKTEAAHVTAAEATSMTAAEATSMAAAEAATPTTSTAHQNRQTAPYIQIDVTGIARLRE